MGKRQRNGTGSFRKRSDGTIEYRVSVGIGPDGKTIRPSFYGATEKECREQYKNWIKHNGERSIETVKTVGEWSDKWLELYKKPPNTAYGTYCNYRMYTERYIKPLIGHLKFSQVRPAHIKQLLTTARNQHGDLLSSSAQHHLYMTLKGIFDTAIENRFCLESPVPKAPKKELSEQIKIKVFSSEHIQTILSSDLPNAEYVKLLLYTGLRLGELLALRWTDVDLPNGVIIVCRSLARAEDGTYTEKVTKSGKPRTIGITPKLASLLSKIPMRGFYVVSEPDGSQLTPHRFEYRYKQVLRDAEVPYLSPHKCRHTYATYLMKGGAEARAIQEILGHSKIEVTELYTHVDTEHIKANVSKLGY